MGESSPDKIYGREFAKQNTWARLRQTKCMSECSPDKIYGREFAEQNIWARVRQTKYMGDSSPDKIYLYYYCIKTLFKDTSPVNGALISTGGVYNVKNYKRYKEKKTIFKLV